MDDPRLAEILASLALQHPDAPEGLELFRWYWAPVRWDRLVAPANDEPRVVALSGPVSPWPRAPRTVVVRPVIFWPGARPAEYNRGGWWASAGWDRSERIAVLFFARGGRDLRPAPLDTAISDAGVSALTSSGYDVLHREAAERLRQLADELGLSEGEEWKREP